MLLPTFFAEPLLSAGSSGRFSHAGAMDPSDLERDRSAFGTGAGGRHFSGPCDKVKQFFFSSPRYTPLEA